MRSQKTQDAINDLKKLPSNVVLDFLETYFIMLAMGGVHSFLPKVPAFGFWQIWLLLFAISGLLANITGSIAAKVLAKVKEVTK